MNQDHRKFGVPCSAPATTDEALELRPTQMKAASGLFRMTQFIRVCHRIVENSQHEHISLQVDDWPDNAVMIDLTTASLVCQVWKAVSFRNKKKLVALVRQGGPLHLVDTCWKAASATSKAA